MNIKSIVENNSTPKGRVFDLIIQALIVISLVTFSMETLPDLSGSTQKILRYVEVCCVGIFTIEYLLRVFVSDHRARFIFSFYGIVDLLAILPFYISAGFDLRSIMRAGGRYVATLVMLQVLDILPFKYQKYIFFEFNSYT